MTIKEEICPTVKADARLMGDGTLWIKTDKLDKVGRVLVEHGTRCKQFYQDTHPEPCEDAVSREEVLNCLEWKYPDKLPRTKIMELPPVTPKQHEIVYCKDCKYFEYDHFESIYGFPLISGHEICTRWSDASQTSENGYCFLAERKEE